MIDDGEYDLDGCPYDGYNWSQEEYVSNMQAHWKNQHYPDPAFRVPQALLQAAWFLNTLDTEKRDKEERWRKAQSFGKK